MKRMDLGIGKDVLIPENWDELTLRHYIAISRGVKDTVGVVVALTGLSEREVLNSNPNVIEMKVLPFVDWVIETEPNFNVNEVPKTIKIKDKQVKVPKELEFKTYGQKVYLTNRIMEVFKDQQDPEESIKNEKFLENFIELIPDALATYLYPEYSGKPFDTEELAEFREFVLDNTKAKEGYPIAYFFLMRSIDSMKSRISTLVDRTAMKNSKQGSKILKSLGILG